MVDLTIVIPTYNGAERLPLVLEWLKKQIDTEGIDWEILVIDNNSNDETAKIIQKYQEHWIHPFSLKYFFETKQGSAFARSKGAQEARGDYICFLDDDNIPNYDWVIQIYRFGQTHPQAGAYGSRVQADFEVEPPKNIEKIIGFLAIRDRGDIANLYQPEIISLPTTAGLIVRKQVWQNCCSQTPSFIGRVEGSMLGGEDYEILINIYKAGWQIWYNPNMHITHKIPASRLKRNYLLSLIKGSCLCLFPLRMMVSNDWHKPAIAFKTVFGNLYNILRHKIKYRRKIKNDMILECELQIYWSRIYSFLYYLNRKLKPIIKEKKNKT